LTVELDDSGEHGVQAAEEAGQRGASLTMLPRTPPPRPQRATSFFQATTKTTWAQPTIPSSNSDALRLNQETARRMIVSTITAAEQRRPAPKRRSRTGIALSIDEDEDR